MKSSLTMLKRAVPLACAALCIAGAAQADLQDRDLNGDTVVDAFYDTDLDITWLRDANVNGKMNWDSAVAWAANHSFGGYSNWRLPTVDTSCRGVGCYGPISEMGHLFHELTVSGGRGLDIFLNFQVSDYWSGTEYAPDLRIAWYYYSYGGGQGYNYKYNELNAMAVRDGDVPSIPEPETYALMLAGLAGLAAVARRRKPR